MLRFLLYIFIHLLASLLLVAIGTTGLARATQAEFPLVLYSENGSLYTFRPGCESLLSECVSEARWLIDDLYSLPAAQTSPNGEYVAVHHGEQWLIYKADCLLSVMKCDGASFDPTFNDVRLAWGPDASVIAYIDSAGRTLRLLTRGCWDESAGECLTQATQLTETGAMRLLGWSADGRMMALLEVLSRNFYRLDMACLDAADGCLNKMQLIDRFTFLPNSFALAPDGEALIYAVDNSGIRYIDQLFYRRLREAEPQRLTFGSGATMPEWSADGRYVVYAGFPSAGSGDLALYVLDMARGLSARLLVHPGQDMQYPSWGREN